MAKNKKEEQGGESKALTPSQRGQQYLADHPNLGFDRVLVTSDCAVFLPTLHGDNAVTNHARGLKDQSIIEVTRGEQSDSEITE